MGIKPSSLTRSFNLSELSSSVNYATVLKYYKVPKSNRSLLTFFCMENLSQCKLAVSSDTSCNDLENGGLQGGFCVFLEDSY